eukprot:Hpha_TRINITY_DN16776_c4_g4::TRINITY_DN16776_c4_g4_i1::g.76496::m.76496
MANPRAKASSSVRLAASSKSATLDIRQTSINWTAVGTDTKGTGTTEGRAFEKRVTAIPTAALLGITTCVSTLVSVACGLLLYFESISAIEATIKDVAYSESLVASIKLTGYFQETLVASKLIDRYLDQSYRVTSSHDLKCQLEMLTRSITLDQRMMNGVGISIIPSYNDPAWLSELVWWDPLTSQEGLISNNMSDQLTVAATYERGGWCGENQTAGTNCLVVRSLNQEAVVLENVYNYSRKYITEDERPFWERHGRQWQNVWSWLSPDNTQYYYIEFRTVRYGVVPSHPILGGVVETVVWVMLYDWRRELVSVNAKGDLFALDLKKGMEGSVYAASWWGFSAKCATREEHASSACNFLISELKAEAREAAVAINGTDPGVVIRAHLNGAEHFVVRRVIFAGEEHDLLAEISLVWLLNVDTIEGKVRRTLMLFVAFILAVTVFDVLILAVEMWKIALPLRRLCRAMRYIDEMDVDAIDAELDVVIPGRFAVSDIVSLTIAFRRAALALRGYKEFLPGYVLMPCPSPAPSEAVPATTMSDFRMDKESLSLSVGQYSGKGTSIRSGDPGGLPEWRSRKGSDAPGSPAMSPRASPTLAPIEYPHLAGAVKLVAVAVINLKDTLRQWADGGIDYKVQSVVSDIQKHVGPTKGLLDGASGDRFWVTWGTSRPVPRVSFHAGEFSFKLKASCSEMLSIGVSCGEALCALTGAVGFRYLTVIGKAVCFAFQLERLARTVEYPDWSPQSVALCTTAVQSDVSHNIISRWLAHVTWEKLGVRPITVWELLKLVPRPEHDEEWMYLLDSGTEADPWSCYNYAVSLCSTNEYERALETLINTEPETKPPVLASLWKIVSHNLKSAIDRATSGGPPPTTARPYLSGMLGGEDFTPASSSYSRPWVGAEPARGQPLKFLFGPGSSTGSKPSHSFERNNSHGQVTWGPLPSLSGSERGEGSPGGSGLLRFGASGHPSGNWRLQSPALGSGSVASECSSRMATSQEV